MVLKSLAIPCITILIQGYFRSHGKCNGTIAFPNQVSCSLVGGMLVVNDHSIDGVIICTGGQDDGEPGLPQLPDMV